MVSEPKPAKKSLGLQDRDQNFRVISTFVLKKNTELNLGTDFSP